MNAPTPNQDKPKLKDFEVEMCRTGVGFCTIRVQAKDEYEAGEKALDEAGNHSYNEKASEYSLVNPVPNPADLATGDPARVLHVFMELTCDEGDRPMPGVKISVTQADLDRFERVFALMAKEELSEVRRYYYPDYLYLDDAPDKTESLDSPELVFAGGGISLQGFAEQSDIVVKTNTITFSELVAAFRSGAEILIINASYPSSSALEFFDDVGQDVTDLAVGTRTIVIAQGGKMTAGEYESFLEERGPADAPRET